MLAKLSRKDQASSFWHEIGKIYKAGQFTDLSIICSDGSSNERWIPCHSLVLASLSPMLREAIRDRASNVAADEPVPVVVQGVGPREVRAALDALYG